MASIYTLVSDIQQLLKRKDGWFTDALAKDFSSEMGRRLQEQLSEAKGPRRLRLSQMGPKCPRALWYSINHPELDEALPPWAEMKFAFGHIVEALAITLAKAAGHTVTGEQDELDLCGVKGHRDCIIDGCLVDVKSAASRSYLKFKDGTIAQDDSFGYLDQLDGYLGASAADNLVTVKDRAYLFAIDKQLGHMCLHEHFHRRGRVENRIPVYREIVARTVPPACTCGTESYGKSGNIGLDMVAGYSAQKWSCFPGLRCFLYSSGPEYLTKVERRPQPHILEVDRHGKVVYGH